MYIFALVNDVEQILSIQIEVIQEAQNGLVASQ